MPVELRVEAVTSTADIATVTQWHRKEGERVAAGDVLVELEVDKAAHDVEAPTSGTLREILVLEGEEVEVGGLLAVIDEDAP